MQVHCSKGTYIRTLCADIGEKLGCGGVMASPVSYTHLDVYKRQYIPQDLLRRAYAADRLRADELIPRVAQIAHAMQQNHTKEQIG